MGIKLNQVILPVPDFKRAVDFYRHLLEIEGQRVSSGRHNFDCGGLILTCVDPQTEGEDFAVSTPYHLRFSVEDPESMFQRAKDAGCTFKDERIITAPWGDRVFAAQDPFGNWLGFADEASAQRSLNELSATGLGDPLTIGKKLSLKHLNSKADDEVFVSIAKVFPDRLWLKLLEASPELTFKEGDAVRVQYWEGDSAFYSETQVCEVSSLEDAYLAIDVPEEVNELLRRTSPRVRTQAPFTLSVVDAPQNSLSLPQSISCHTIDLGVGGMKFETNLPLEQGSQVEFKLSLPGLEIPVGLEVVTAEQEERGGETVHSVGARFVELALEDQMKLLQFLIDSSEDSQAATEGQAGSDVEEIAASSEEVHFEAESAPQPESEPAAAPSPLIFKISQEKDTELGRVEQSDEGNLQQDASEAVAVVQEDLQNPDVTDSPPETHFQVVGSSIGDAGTGQTPLEEKAAVK